MVYDFERERFAQIGLTPEQFTGDQLWVINEPFDAPENYYQDGEIDADDAYYFWIKKLESVGISNKDISKIKRLVQ